MTTERHPDVVHVRLDGEVDMGNADRLGRRVVGEVLEGAAHDGASADGGGSGAVLALDLSGLTYIDSSGLRMLEEVRHSLSAKGVRTFTIAPDSCRAYRLLALTGLVEHLATEPDLARVRSVLADGEG